jgi:hypothetical protein
VRSATPKTSVVISKSTTYTVAVGDDGKLIASDATAGAFTITLPVAATAGDGFEISVVKIDSSANAVTIDGDGSETINDESDLDLEVQFDSVVLRSDGSEWFATVRPSSTATPLPRGYIDGLILSNNSTDAEHDIDISAGKARDEDDEANLTLAATLTKAIDSAWAVGDGNGGLDTGTVTTASWYHIFLIRRSDTGVVDALFSTSATAPTMPTNYDQQRRIGAVLTDGSSNIIAFVQLGDEFLWDVVVSDRNGADPGTSAVLTTLDVPTGVQVRANVSVPLSDTTPAATTNIIVSSPDQADTAPTDNLRDAAVGTDNFRTTVTKLVRTDTSARIRTRLSNSDAGVILQVLTHGWVDRRGKE